jgi:hypothetical protein
MSQSNLALSTNEWISMMLGGGSIRALLSAEGKKIDGGAERKRESERVNDTSFVYARSGERVQKPVKMPFNVYRT